MKDVTTIVQHIVGDRPKDSEVGHSFFLQPEALLGMFIIPCSSSCCIIYKDITHTWA
jgi:hypothetical protein